MNFLLEPYPVSIESMIKKSEESISILLDRLNDSNCKTLGELYKEVNGRVQQQKNIFNTLGFTPNSKLSKTTKVDNEIKGIYLFGEAMSNRVIPRYVGISGTIIRRLKQHGWSKLHNEATLAYLIAALKSSYVGKRSGLDLSSLQQEQRLVQGYKVAILQEELDYDLYFMEVYIAGKLKTYWNAFETH